MTPPQLRSALASSRLRLPPARRAGGFTLIELLTVIAIIGILAAILIPTVGAVRGQARAAQCTSNQRQLALSLLMYAQENKDQLPGPNSPRWDYAALSHFTQTTPAPYNGILKCPADNIKRAGTPASEIRSYTYNPTLCNLQDSYKDTARWGVNPPPMNTGIQLSALTAASRTVILLEKHSDDNLYNQPSSIMAASIRDTHRGSMNVAYCDGHAGKVSVSTPQTDFETRYLSRGQ